MVGNIRVETKVLKMLADDRRLQLAVAETLARSFVIVKLLDQLLKTELEERLARDLTVVLGELAAPFSAARISVMSEP